MFDKKIYVETFSVLHASGDTLDRVYRAAAQKRTPALNRIRPALILAAALVLTVSSVVLAAGGRIMGGWPHRASIRAAEDMGFTCPEQIGEYRLLDDSSTSIHVTHEDSGWLSAWLKPDYTWMSLDYKNTDGQYLSLSFGRTDNPLWAYCFDYDEASGVWLGAAKFHWTNDTVPDTKVLGNDSFAANVTETVYKGCTIYLADRIISASSDIDPAQWNTDGTLAEAHWVDPEIGICFAITACPEQMQDNAEESSADQIQDSVVSHDVNRIHNKSEAAQKELLACARSVIDHNR